MPFFRTLSDLELQQLSDDELIARVHDARDAGEFEAGKLALSVLVFGHLANLERRVALKVPARDVELVASSVMISALTSAFNGHSVGEFHAWLGTILARRVADYHRRGRVDQVALPDEHLDDDAIWGQLPGVEDDTTLVAVQGLLDELLAKLSAVHRRVVELCVLEQVAAAEVSRAVAAEFPGERVSVDNVYKIAQRFRDQLRQRLESDGS